MIYLQDFPYMKTLSREIRLPKGEPTGFGNMVFLLSKDFESSIAMIQNKTIDNANKYYYYYYNRQYKGMLYNRTYNIRDFEVQLQNYDRIEEMTLLKRHPLKPLNKTSFRNTYFDMCKYMEIFFKLTAKQPPIKRIESFWRYIRSITERDDVKNYNKIMLIDVDMFVDTDFTIKNIVNQVPYLFYYTLYRYPYLIDTYDIDIVFYCKNWALKINPSKMGTKAHNLFRTELNKLYKHSKKAIDIEAIDVKELDINIQKETIKKEMSEKLNFTGDEPSEVIDINALTDEHEEMSDIEREVSNKVDAVTDEILDIVPDPEDSISDIGEVIKNRTESEIANDKEFIEKIYTYNQKKSTRSAASTARDELLRKEQKQIKIENMTLEDLTKSSSATGINLQTKNVSNVVKTTNQNMKEIKFSSFEKVYNEQVMKKDLMNIFVDLNNKSIPMYIRKVEVEDSSDELNYKETYRIYLEDENRNRHTITVDIPKFIEDKFMYLGGNKKLIIKQNFMYPVVKTAPDTVQIVTNINKMFITRIGTRSLGIIEKTKKFISSNPDVNKYFKFGNASIVNRDYLTTIEYDELSKMIVEFKSNGTQIYLNQKKALSVADEKNIKIPEGFIFIGFRDKEPILLDSTTQVTKDNKNICEIIIESLPEEYLSIFLSTKIGKRLMYNSAKIMAQAIPLVSLLCLWEGLTEVLKKAKVEYKLSEKLPRDLGINESYIRFADCYLIYKDNIEVSLLLNGLNILPCNEYTIAEMDTHEPYIDYMGSVYGKKNIIYTLFNSYEFMIDPITLEILEDINLPTDITNLSIYASNLLADNGYTRENQQHIYRIRSNEIVPAILSSVIANEYTSFRNSGGKKKLSVKRDAVIKELMKLQTVEDYSTLNAIVELEKSRTVTAKGWRGTNVDRAYTIEKRSYDPSMLGVMAMSTSPDGNVGIVRALTLEPKITNVRGYVEINNENLDNLTDANLFSAGELLTTQGARCDDSSRTAMALKQSKHVIPTKRSSPVLISNGSDEVVRFSLSSDFAVNADDDGEVIEKNEKTGIMVVKYKNGNIRAIDLSNHIVKNGAGGFYLGNQLETKFNVGDKFKKNECLAWHNKFFTESKISGNALNMGTLEKIAIMSSYNNYQDGCFITEKLSEDTAAELIFEEAGVIGKNATLDFMLNIGDKVETGDIICSFDTSYEDSDLNKFLASLSNELKEEVNEKSKQVIKAHHSGVIVDIKMYCTVELDELSPTIRPYVEKYYKKINERKKQLSKYDDSNSIVKCGLLLNEASGKVIPNTYGLIKGHKVEDGVLIEFYIKYVDIMAIGDKLA